MWFYSLTRKLHLISLRLQLHLISPNILECLIALRFTDASLLLNVHDYKKHDLLKLQFSQHHQLLLHKVASNTNELRTSTTPQLFCLPDMATKTLRECLEDLPQELYDEIYKHTFAPPAEDTIISVDNFYKPPAVCQINRTTRKSFQAAYKKCTFVGEIKSLITWLESLQKPGHFESIVCWNDGVRLRSSAYAAALTTFYQLAWSFDRSMRSNVVIVDSRKTANELLRMANDDDRWRPQARQMASGFMLTVYEIRDTIRDEKQWVTFPKTSLAHKYGFSWRG